MAYNGIIGANCISKFFLDRLMENLRDGADEDAQVNLFLETLESLPDCSDMAEEPLEPGKRISNNGKLVEEPKKKRKLTLYQQHMSKCAKKENGKSFPQCVVEWNKIKSSLQTQ
ncbi:MAG: hypothetical protein O8C67_04890 [Candidatus Methanoperedens sp.]|nr:hypothetical protein [Candidatus Methanoperedens sp.]